MPQAGWPAIRAMGRVNGQGRGGADFSCADGRDESGGTVDRTSRSDKGFEIAQGEETNL